MKTKQRFLSLVLAFVLMAGFAVGATNAFAAKGETSTFGVHAEATVERAVKGTSRVTAIGVWDIECWDKDGNLKWVIKGLENLVTNEGLDAILNVMFNAATQITTWYVVIFETDTTPAAGHTYAVPVYTESTAYDEATRPEYQEAASSGQSITNSANKATFTISATKTIYGAALVGGGSAPTTKGDTAGGGTLYNSVQFGTAKPVEDNDVLKITVTINSSDV